MNRETFKLFVARTLEEVIALAEEKAQRQLPRKFVFRWLGKGYPLIEKGIVDHIVERVFVDDEHIYPCVDIGIADALEDGSLLIVANIAGYAPCSFRSNWTGRNGPFVYIVGAPFLEKMAGRTSAWAPETSAFGFIIPDVKTPGFNQRGYLFKCRNHYL